MSEYVGCLNELHDQGRIDLSEALSWWIEKVRVHSASEGPKFPFDTGKSLRANIQDLLTQARELQADAGATNYLGAMLHHLLGAKLDVGQFLTANIYERSLFKAADCKVTLANLLKRYNEIVASCETDPSLRFNLGSSRSGTP